MIIYNITANIEDSIHDDWLEWIQQHIPKVLATGFFMKATFTKVLVEESMGGLTYSIQYLAPSKEALEYCNHTLNDGKSKKIFRATLS
jgi:hypothetical protein